MNRTGVFLRPSAWLAVLAALVLLLLPIALIAWLLLRDAADPPWLAALSGYLSYGTRTRLETLVLKQAARAARPDLFTRAMSRFTYGNSAHYQVDFDVDNTFLYSGRPLPYPPDELWCALLTPAGGLSVQVVFLARHVDEYTGQWVVHEAGDRDAPQVAQALAAVGCDVAVR